MKAKNIHYSKNILFVLFVRQCIYDIPAVGKDTLSNAANIEAEDTDTIINEILLTELAAYQFPTTNITLTIKGILYIQELIFNHLEDNEGIQFFFQTIYSLSNQKYLIQQTLVPEQKKLLITLIKEINIYTPYIKNTGAIHNGLLSLVEHIREGISNTNSDIAKQLYYVTALQIFFDYWISKENESISTHIVSLCNCIRRRLSDYLILPNQNQLLF